MIKKNKIKIIDNDIVHRLNILESKILKFESKILSLEIKYFSKDSKSK